MQVKQRHPASINGSDTGTGKTYLEMAIAAALQEPTLVICPKVARTAWSKAAKHFEDSISIVGYEMLRTGGTDFGRWENNQRVADEEFICTNCLCKVTPGCFPCYTRPDGIHCVERKKKSIRRGKFQFHPAIKHIIFDEAHRCNAIDSLNADMMLAAKDRRVSILSATAAHSPIQMRAMGYLLGLHNDKADLMTKTPLGLDKRVLPSFKLWASRYGAHWEPAFRGYKWLVGKERQLSAMNEIRSVLFPEHGVRIAWKDIPGFPDRTITAELYDLDNPEAIDSQYQKMREAIELLHDKKKADKAPTSPLTMQLRARQEIELLKVPVFEELALDYYAKGMSVVFFVNYRQTIDELFKRFPSARIIDGQTKNRDEAVEEFQANKIRFLIVNNEAGGLALSLQDLTGFFPRVGLVSPCFSATTMRQVFGRLHRDAGLSPCFYHVIFINGTIEVKVHRAVQPKLNNLDALNDGDMEPENLKLV